MPLFLYAQVQGERGVALYESYQRNIPLIQELAMGGLYEDPPMNIKGHSRFLNTTFSPGEVVINGITYKKVNLSYDIHADELITFHPVFSKKISLQPGRVNSFILSDGSHFIFKSGLKDFVSHRNGYYQLLWDQRVQILAKHRKVVKNDPDRDEFLYRFISKVDYIIEKEQEAFLIKNGNHALRILNIEKKEIRKPLRDNNMNYKRDPVSYLLFIGRYYSSQVD